uniref:Succinate--CoA ligase [ADP-forming] subunit beta, mitochondrial n=1 Tax=Parascaris univalens TaxID=6257 RepID=A0A914ZN72_PARUN
MLPMLSRIGERILQSGVYRPLQSIRMLNLQEYQSKKLLEDYGCCIQRFIVASSRADAERQMEDFNRRRYMVKSQILAGGRGKGRFIGGRSDLGGVAVAEGKQEALNLAGEMVGKTLVTKQTGKKGLPVKKVLICEAVSIKRETYLAIVMDRETGGPVVVYSPAGGMDIETVAATNPELVFKEAVDIDKGLTKGQADKIAKNLGFSGVSAERAAYEISCLYKLFIGVDATQVEINPLAETEGMQAYCIDAKLNFDDNAYFRQKEIFAMEEPSNSEAKARELLAEKHDLNYVALEGNIGCMVNGAGLAMATMDIIKLYGGSPANFLDVGGSVTEEAVTAAFSIITSDPQVEAILVNIFGGIVSCLVIANGVIAACKKTQLKVPLIIRLEGTKAAEAREALEASGLKVITAGNMDEAAKKAVAAVQH